MALHTLKNIPEPMRSWRWQFGAQGGAIQPGSSPPPTEELTLPDKPSIVVLPFDNMSAEPGQDYLADGIVEAITAALSRIRSFRHRAQFRIHLQGPSDKCARHRPGVGRCLLAGRQRAENGQ